MLNGIKERKNGMREGRKKGRRGEGEEERKGGRKILRAELRY